jgi:hypothetical protein
MTAIEMAWLAALALALVIGVAAGLYLAGRRARRSVSRLALPGDRVVATGAAGTRRGIERARRERRIEVREALRR